MVVSAGSNASGGRRRSSGVGGKMQQRSLFSFFSKKRVESSRNSPKQAVRKSVSPSPSEGVLDEPFSNSHSQSSTDPPSPLEFLQDSTVTPILKARREPNGRTMEMDEVNECKGVCVSWYDLTSFCRMGNGMRQERCVSFDVYFVFYLKVLGKDGKSLVRAVQGAVVVDGWICEVMLVV